MLEPPALPTMLTSVSCAGSTSVTFQPASALVLPRFDGVSVYCTCLPG